MEALASSRPESNVKQPLQPMPKHFWPQKFKSRSASLTSQAAAAVGSFVGSAFAWGLEPKLAELIRLPKENFLEIVSGRISALVIVMKSVMRLAGAENVPRMQYKSMGHSVSPFRAWCQRRTTHPKQPPAPRMEQQEYLNMSFQQLTKGLSCFSQLPPFALELAFTQTGSF